MTQLTKDTPAGYYLTKDESGHSYLVEWPVSRFLGGTEIITRLVPESPLTAPGELIEAARKALNRITFTGHQPLILELEAFLDSLTPGEPQEALPIGEQLKAFRIKHQMGLRQFAIAIGAVPSRLCNFENGKPSLEIVQEVGERPARTITGDGVTRLPEGVWCAFEQERYRGCFTSNDAIASPGFTYVFVGPIPPPPANAKLAEPRVFLAQHNGKSKHWFIEWPDGAMHSQFSAGFMLGFSFPSRADFKAAGWREVK